MPVGPKRVIPGRLSVSRTFGDPVAKLPCYGGKPGVVTAIPDIKAFKILDSCDFIILGSDGVYDTMSNKDIMSTVLATIKTQKESDTIHELCARSVENVINNSLIKQTLDNVSVVMIAFKHFNKVASNGLVERSSEAFDKSVVEADDYRGLKKIQKLLMT